MQDSEQYIQNLYARLAQLQQSDDEESVQEAQNTLETIDSERTMIEYLKNLMNEKKTELAKNQRVLKPVNRFNNANSKFVFLV